VGATIKWAGVENSYFAAIFIPSKPADVYMYPPAEEKKEPVDVMLSLAPQQKEVMELKVFIGPKDYILLKIWEWISRRPWISASSWARL